MISVLIADDEKLARKTIRYLLETQKDVENIYEAEDGNAVLALVEKYKPDIVFLDIQMPGKTGLEVAELLPEDVTIIFSTAYDEYAIAAFELNAIGYLLKPFEDDKFYNSLQKARVQIIERNHTDFKKVKELIHHLIEEKDNRYKNRLVIKDPGRIRLVDVADINYIVGAGNYAELHLFDGKTLLHRETLTALEKQLDPNEFLRIHRSSLVRIRSVKELRLNDSGDYTVLLSSGENLTLSRRNKDKLEVLLGEA